MLMLLRGRAAWSMVARRRRRFYSTTNSTPSNSSNFNYCVESVRTNDFNTYIETLVTPSSAMRAAFAVRAFHIEVMSVARRTQSAASSSSGAVPSTAEMKLLFWREQVDRVFETANGRADLRRLNEPVSDELVRAVAEHKLSKHWFARLVDSRRQFVTARSFKDMAELEKYADASMSSVFYILLSSMGVKNVDSDHAASHLGKALLLADVVRKLLRRSPHCVFYMPDELLVRHHIAQQDLVNMSERQLAAKHAHLKDLVFEVCTRAKQHVNSSRELRDKVPSGARPLFAPIVALDLFLTQMERAGFDPLNAKLAAADHHRTRIIAKLLVAKFTNNFY